jgi:hypothetical protein
MHWLVADSRIEDVEVSRHGQGDKVGLAIPGVPDLLMIDCRSHSPGCYCFLSLRIPFRQVICKSSGGGKRKQRTNKV